MFSNLHVSVLLLRVFPVNHVFVMVDLMIIVVLSPVVDGDELEEVLALPLAGDEDHQGARAGAVSPQAGHEGLEHLELGWSGQHSQDLSENI